jgi:hypothetical protein
MKEGLNVILSNDRKKVRKQIEALEWQLTQPEDDYSRQIHEETLEQLKAHLETLS